MNFLLKDDLLMELFNKTKKNDARGALYIICIIWPISHKQLTNNNLRQKLEMYRIAIFFKSGRNRITLDIK